MIMNQVSALILCLAAATCAGFENISPEADKGTEHSATEESSVVRNRRIKSATLIKQFAKQFAKGVAKEVAKDVLKDLVGDSSDGSSSNGNTGSDNLASRSCFEDYSTLDLFSLPVATEQDILDSCDIQTDFNLMYTAQIRCDYGGSSFVSRFESYCESDSRFHMVPVTTHDYPGAYNLFITDDFGTIYQVSYILQENNPACLPKACNYMEADSILNEFENYMVLMNGYQQANYVLPADYTSKTSSNSNVPSSGSEGLGVSTLAAVVSIAFSVFLLQM